MAGSSPAMTTKRVAASLRQSQPQNLQDGLSACETHRTVSELLMMGIASLNPSYEFFSAVIPAKAGIQ
jgi:hypothetical protein